VSIYAVASADLFRVIYCDGHRNSSGAISYPIRDLGCTQVRGKSIFVIEHLPGPKACRMRSEMLAQGARRSSGQ